ncbi:MAG: M14 family metallopeptidase [Clostridiales bacterium]|nr:M14 family metallopeptidase [Clostridiales bacterium]
MKKKARLLTLIAGIILISSGIFLNIPGDKTALSSTNDSDENYPDHSMDLTELYKEPEYKEANLNEYLEYHNNYPGTPWPDLVYTVNLLYFGRELQVSFPTYSLAEANARLKELGVNGEMTIAGMNAAVFNKAISTVWQEIIPKDNALPKKFKKYNLNTTYTYQKLEEYIKDLSRYRLARLFVIGKTGGGRNIYSLTIGNGRGKIMLYIGNVHAKEQFGTAALIQMAYEILEKAQQDPYCRELLNQIKIVLIPSLNPDGREIVINKPKEQKKGGLKGSASGIDLNRNNIGPETGFWDHGKTLLKENLYKGEYLGQALETRALIKWIYYYVGEEKAQSLISFHQAGQVIYGIADYVPQKNPQKDQDFENLLSGITGYEHINNSPFGSGACGYEDSFAGAIAAGAQFSPYGLLAYPHQDSLEHLAYLRGLEGYQFPEPLVQDFVYATLESLKVDANFLKGYKKEYQKHGFSRIFLEVAEYFLGAKKVAEIKAQANG